MRIFILISMSLFMGCAHQRASSVKPVPVVAKNTRSLTTEKTTTEMREAKDVAQEKAMIMARKKAGSGVREPQLSAHPQNKKLELSLKPQAERLAPESQLFEEIQGYYEQNDEIRFVSRYQAFEQSYSRSPRMAEVHYMAGLLFLANKDYGRALKAFDRVLTTPRHGHAPKALFAKAVTYKKMNLPEVSQPLLKQVQARYPKSIESQRAAIELKILEQKSE